MTSSDWWSILLFIHAQNLVTGHLFPLSTVSMRSCFHFVSVYWFHCWLFKVINIHISTQCYKSRREKSCLLLLWPLQEPQKSGKVEVISCNHCKDCVKHEDIIIESFCLYCKDFPEECNPISSCMSESFRMSLKTQIVDHDHDSDYKVRVHLLTTTLGLQSQGASDA